MGWFGSSEEQGVKKTSGGAFENPGRANRQKCYESRDAFFECLDRNNILDSINTKKGQAAAKTACSAEDVVFEKNCAHSWVSAVLIWAVDAVASWRVMLT
jgi:cytochrome c oxidase assembly factor 6